MFFIHSKLIIILYNIDQQKEYIMSKDTAVESCKYVLRIVLYYLQEKEGDPLGEGSPR